MGLLDLKLGLFHVTRLKNDLDAQHAVYGPELRALRQLQRDYPTTPYLFVSERGGPMTDSNARKMVKRAVEHAELGFPVHPHMLRHSTG
jgi:site-specific recombinase XerD